MESKALNLLLLFGLFILIEWSQGFNGVWSAHIKYCIDHWEYKCNITNWHMCSLCLNLEFLFGMFRCLCVCEYIIPSSQQSLCVSAGLRIESRCNFPYTKTPTSGTKGEESILQVQAALFPRTPESYRLSWPVTTHSFPAWICVFREPQRCRSCLTVFLSWCKAFIRVQTCL